MKKLRTKRSSADQFKAWWLMQRQKMRRHAPAAPTITSGTFDANASDGTWFDGIINFTFVHGTFPVATLEVWFSLNGDPFALVGTVASNATTYRHLQAAQGEDLLTYKLRYVNGSVVGSFSDVYAIQISL